MTTFLPDVLLGTQLPRLSNVPQGVRSDGPDATDLAAAADLALDPWQSYALDCFFQIDAAGQWVTRDGLLVVPRQNGKGALLEAWALSKLFLKGSAGVLHTAHEATTAFDAFKKMRARIESSDWLLSRLKKDRSGGIRVANGEWGFTFSTGQQLNYKTRTTGAARGLTVDDLIVDEVQNLNDLELDALSSVVAAKPHAQTILTGSAPITGSSTVLRRMVAAGRRGDPSLTYLEWSADETVDHDLDDPRLWAQANPGYGIRLFDKTFMSERMKQSDEGFAREHLGIVEVVDSSVFPRGVWARLADPESKIADRVSFAVEVAEDRSWSCIAAAGKGGLGVHVESVAYQPGTDWVVARAKALSAVHRSSAFVIQPSSAAGALSADFRNAGLTVVDVSAQQYAQACGDLFDAVVNGELKHLAQPELDISVSGAKKKTAGDAFVWDRRRSLDISPLAAVTLAFWGANQAPRPGRFVSF